MKLERVRPTVWRMTLHPLELATIMSAVRWAADDPDGELPAGAVEQLRAVVRSYDTAAGTGTDTAPPTDAGGGTEAADSPVADGDG